MAETRRKAGPTSRLLARGQARLWCEQLERGPGGVAGGVSAGLLRPAWGQMPSGQLWTWVADAGHRGACGLRPDGGHRACRGSPRRLRRSTPGSGQMVSGVTGAGRSEPWRQRLGAAHVRTRKSAIREPLGHSAREVFRVLEHQEGQDKACGGASHSGCLVGWRRRHGSGRTAGREDL